MSKKRASSSKKRTTASKRAATKVVEPATSSSSPPVSPAAQIEPKESFFDLSYEEKLKSISECAENGKTKIKEMDITGIRRLTLDTRFSYLPMETQLECWLILGQEEYAKRDRSSSEVRECCYRGLAIFPDGVNDYRRLSLMVLLAFVDLDERKKSGYSILDNVIGELELVPERTSEVDALRSTVLLRIASELWNSGKKDRARGIYEHLCSSSIDPTTRVSTLLNLAQKYVIDDNLSESRSLYERALELAKNGPLPKMELDSQMGLCKIHRLRGDFSPALVLYEEIAEQALSVELFETASSALLSLGELHSRSGNVLLAMEKYSQWINLTDQHDNSPEMKAIGLLAFAKLQIEQGETANAKQNISKAKNLVEGINSGDTQRTILWLDSLLLISQDQKKKAAKLLEQIMNDARELRSNSLRMQIGVAKVKELLETSSLSDALWEMKDLAKVAKEQKIHLAYLYIQLVCAEMVKELNSERESRETILQSALGYAREKQLNVLAEIINDRLLREAYPWKSSFNEFEKIIPVLPESLTS